jgi:branched-chain amino acid transport system permease protein
MLRQLLDKLTDWLKTTAGVLVTASLVALIIGTIDQGPYLLVNTIVSGGMLALMAIGLALVFGVLNIPQFAHGDFFMAGGLAAYFVFSPIAVILEENPESSLAIYGPLLAIGAAMIAGAILGAAAEITLFRELRARSRENWVMNTFLLTVGLSSVLINGHQMIFGADFKGIVGYWDFDPLEIFGVFISMDRAMAFIISVSAIVLFYGFMKYTRIGKAIRAVSQDETGALMVGIGLPAILVLTQALSGALAGLAGGSLLFLFPSYPTVGMYPLYMAWFVVILVGLGNILGALIGGFIVALLIQLTAAYVGEGYEFIIPSIVIIAVLIFKPSGIFGSEVRGVLDQ